MLERVTRMVCAALIVVVTTLITFAAFRRWAIDSLPIAAVFSALYWLIGTVWLIRSGVWRE